MLQSGKIPLWIVATIAGTGVLVVVGLFFYGAYAGVGSAMQDNQPDYVSGKLKIRSGLSEQLGELATHLLLDVFSQTLLSLTGYKIEK